MMVHRTNNCYNETDNRALKYSAFRLAIASSTTRYSLQDISLNLNLERSNLHRLEFNSTTAI